MFLGDVISIQLIVNRVVHIRANIVYSLWLHFLGVGRRDWLVYWYAWSYVAWLLLGLSVVRRILTSLVVCVVLIHYNYI